jgi:hypothetical protein
MRKFIYVSSELILIFKIIIMCKLLVKNELKKLRSTLRLKKRVN